MCWQNSIRHNLSLYDMFVRVKSERSDRANVSYWTLCSSDDVNEVKSQPTTSHTINNIHVKTQPTSRGITNIPPGTLNYRSSVVQSSSSNKLVVPWTRLNTVSDCASKFTRFESSWLQRGKCRKRRCTKHTSLSWMNWNGEWEQSGPSRITSSLCQPFVSGIVVSSRSVVRALYILQYFWTSLIADFKFPKIVNIDWIQTWKSWRPQLQWDKCWSLFLYQLNGSTCTMSISSFTR